jgi:hypothetical protein
VGGISASTLAQGSISMRIVKLTVSPLSDEKARIWRSI